MWQRSRQRDAHVTRLDFVRRAILADLTPGQKLFATAAVIAVPTGLRAALGDSADPVPFVTYFPAILIAAVFLGWRWAVGATLVAVAIVYWLFLSALWLQQAQSGEPAIFVFLWCILLNTHHGG